MGKLTLNRSRWVMRLIGALCAISAVVACSVGIDRMMMGDAQAQAPASPVGAAQMVQAASGDGTMAGVFEHGLPAGFQDELFDADGFEDLRHTADGKVAGMSAKGAPEEVCARLSRQMVERGWTAFDSGDTARTTFVKDTGQFAWACIDCTEVGGRTSVVVVLQRKDAQ